jgi:hypothetical protein
VRVKVSFSLRVRLFSGHEWPPTVPEPPLSSAPEIVHQEAGTRSSLFKDNSGLHRAQQSLHTKKQKAKAIKDLADSSSGRNSANAAEVSLTSVTLHFRTYDSETRRSSLPQSSIPALQEQVSWLASSSADLSQPLRKIVVKVHDFLVSYSPLGAKPKKILGDRSSLIPLPHPHRVLEELSETNREQQATP